MMTAAMANSSSCCAEVVKLPVPLWKMSPRRQPREESGERIDQDEVFCVLMPARTEASMLPADGIGVLREAGVLHRCQSTTRRTMIR